MTPFRPAVLRLPPPSVQGIVTRLNPELIIPRKVKYAEEEEIHGAGQVVKAHLDLGLSLFRRDPLVGLLVGLAGAGVGVGITYLLYSAIQRSNRLN